MGSSAPALIRRGHGRLGPTPATGTRGVARGQHATARFAALSAVALALLASGCGSSASTSTSSTAASVSPSLTKQQFLLKANAICTAGNKARNAAVLALGNNPTEKQITTYAKTVFVPSVQGSITAILALSTQTADHAKLASILGLAQSELDQVKAKPLLLTNPQQFASFAKQAHPYGLTACARKA